MKVVDGDTVYVLDSAQERHKIRLAGIDIETCPACGGTLRIIACIEDPAVIKKIPSLGP